MAVSPTSPATSTSGPVSGTAIDVASIVGQLMEVEKQPLNRLQAKIADSGVKISALGMFQGNLTSLQAALKDLQTKSNFAATEPSFSRSGIATATLSSLAKEASYQLSVSALAQKNIWNVTGFNDAASAEAWYNDPNNGVKDKASYALFKNSAGQMVLSLTAKSAGVLAGFSINSANLPLGASATQFQTGQDARFEVNGIEFTRSTNAVADAITGVTLALQSTTSSPVTFTVGQSALTARPKLEALVTAFNELQSSYKVLSQPSIDPASRGVLNSDSSLRSIMREIVNGLGLPLTTADGAALGGQSDLSVLGLELDQSGQLKINDNLLKASTGLQSLLAQGVRIGYLADSGDLASRIDKMFNPGGALAERLESEKKTQTDLNSRARALEEKLASAEARYRAQYASLNALLYQLSNTSTALKSALDGLAAQSKND